MTRRQIVAVLLASLALVLAASAYRHASLGWQRSAAYWGTWAK